MYRFKLKEIEVGDTDTKGGKKSTVTDVNPETGAITWDIKDVADFTSTYKELEKAKDFLSKLEKTGKSKDDPAIDKLAAEIQELFNTFRTHIRKNYPEEYKRVLRLKESVNEQSEQWTQLDVININKSLRLALKTFNNLVRNLKRLEGELGKHSNKPQGNLLQGMAPDSFDYMGVQNKLNKLYNAFSNAFSIDESVNESVNYRDMAVKSANAWDGGEFLKYINDLNKKNVKIPKKYMKDLLDTIKYANKHKDEKGSDYHQTEAINDFYDTLEILFKNGILTGKELNESVNEDALQGPETKDVYKVGDTIIYRKGNVAHSGTVELRTKDFDYYVTDDSDGKGYLVKMDDVIGLNLEEGEGIGYLTPRAFAKNKKSKGAPSIYYYKLGYKPVPKIKPKGFEVKQLFEKEELTEYSDFQQKRINVFDEIEEKVNSISPLLSSAKNKTAEYYNENPGSYTIVYSTDMANELLDDIIELLKQSE